METESNVPVTEPAKVQDKNKLIIGGIGILALILIAVSLVKRDKKEAPIKKKVPRQPVVINNFLNGKEVPTKQKVKKPDIEIPLELEEEEEEEDGK